MRKIKFRVWHTELKKWVKPPVSFWPSVDSDNYKEMYLEADDFMGGPLDGVVFLQYTGLKDKNGVEIYEGDIVKAFWEGIPEKKINAVEWKLGGFDYHSNFLPNSENLNCEVIGNIYENLELLTV